MGTTRMSDDATVFFIGDRYLVRLPPDEDPDDGEPPAQSPTFIAPPSAAFAEAGVGSDGLALSVVRERELELRAQADDVGEPLSVSYIWSAFEAGGKPVRFVPNGTNAAQTTTAHFEAPGEYILTVTARAATGAAAVESIAVAVVPAVAVVEVSPWVGELKVGESLQFSVAAYDQFGGLLVGDTETAIWIPQGGGTVDASGLFTATSAGGPFELTATIGAQVGQAAILVGAAPADLFFENLLQLYDGSGKSVAVKTVPEGLPVAVTYNGEARVPVEAGSYAVEAHILDVNFAGHATAVLVIERPQFDLVVSASPAEGGSVAGSGLFDAGVLTSISATPATGWRFVRWSGPGVSDQGMASSAVLLEEPTFATAMFELIPPYETWAAARNLSAAAADPYADPDGDGMVNLFEYATGGDPMVPGIAAVTVSQSGGALRLTYDRIADPSLTYTVETASSLSGPWTQLIAAGNPSTGAANVEGPVTVVDSVPLDAQPKRLLRLRVSH